MGSYSASVSQSKQNTVILPELKSAGTFASPDSVASSPGSNAVKIEGVANTVKQSFTGDIGFTGREVSNLINKIRLRDNDFVNSVSGRMGDFVNSVSGQMGGAVSEMGDTFTSFADKLTDNKAGETGKFEKLFQNFLIAITVIVGVVFFLKGKK